MGTPAIRYIKLGHKGRWEKDCLTNSHTIRLGFESPYHDECLKGNWGKLEEFWLTYRKGKQGPATSSVNQIKDFYELSSTDIWITFYQRRLYWCHAGEEIEELSDGSRVRKALNGWSCKDKKGNDIHIENIDGRVSSVQGYRGTICKPKLTDYIIRKINGETQPEIDDAQKALSNLKTSVSTLINGLWWNDFELLIDLIFTQSGWQRISVLGKTEKDIDLDLFSPVTQKKAFVQIKSQTNIEQYRSYAEIFAQYPQYDEMYYVFHTSPDDLHELAEPKPNISIWGLDRIADLVINAGLIGWLIEKRR